MTIIEDSFTKLYINLNRVKEFVLTLEHVHSFKNLKELHPEMLPTDLISKLRKLDSAFDTKQIRHYYRIFSIVFSIPWKN